MIIGLITLFSVGLLISVIGLINMSGNISSIHEYHRHRVTEEDRKPFGKLVGIGTLITGVAVIIFGVLIFVFEKTNIEYISVIATVELILGIVIGTAISFYAMKKYNKGIF